MARGAQTLQYTHLPARPYLRNQQQLDHRNTSRTTTQVVEVNTIHSFSHMLRHWRLDIIPAPSSKPLSPALPNQSSRYPPGMQSTHHYLVAWLTYCFYHYLPASTHTSFLSTAIRFELVPLLISPHTFDLNHSWPPNPWPCQPSPASQYLPGMHPPAQPPISSSSSENPHSENGGDSAPCPTL